MAEVMKQRILNVDDTEAGRYAVSRILSKAGYEVMEAANGMDALSLVAQHPDLVLLDVNLPDIDGFEVCKRIKADPATASIPVVHLSATYVAGRHLVQGMEGGADGYLTHPVEAPVLVATIRAYLRLSAAETALRESEDRNRDLVEHSRDLICTHDLDGRLLWVNTAAVQISGYSRETLLAMNMADLLTLGSRAGFAAYLAEIQSKGEASGLMRVRTATGETRWWEYHNTLRADGVAAPVVRGMVQDVTERKRGEQQLIESEERFRGLVEQSIAGIYIIQDNKFAYVNPRTAEIFGFDNADEMIGQDPLSAVAQEDRDLVARSIGEHIEGKLLNKAYELTIRRKDGSLSQVGVNSVHATYEGRPAVIGMVQDIAEKKRAEEKIERYVEQLETAFMSTVEVATTLGEMRDPYTAGHQRRVAKIAVAIGAELGFDAQRQEGLRVAGYLHDIGKIAIPAEILAKPGQLSKTEHQLIQCHAQASYDVLKDVEFPWPVAQVALQHHERIDGSGYPQGLKGEAILLEARILAVADVVEAMSSHRPYRPGLGIDKALAEIEAGSGTRYDPTVASTCLKLFREKGYVIPA